MLRRLSLFIILLSTCALAQAKKNTKLDSLYMKLDEAIGNENQYQEQEEKFISKLKHQLDDSHLSIDDLYSIYHQLSNEYEFYRCDSARFYALKRLSIAESSGKTNWIIDSKIQLASILSKAVMFNEAVDLLEGIPVKELSKQQEVNYYKAFYEVYVFKIDFFEDGYGDELLNQKRDFYYENFLKVLPTNIYEYASYYGIKYINNHEFEKAKKVLYDFLPNVKIGTRPYSILHSVLGFLYEQTGETEKVKEYLALSALSDVQGNIMENASLRSLAAILYDEGDIDRANTYIKKSMEDANFYNSRIRNFQTSKVLSIIDKAYQIDRIKQQKKLEKLLIIISILSFVLLIGISFIIGQIRIMSNAKKKISVFNEQLKLKNIALAEANHALADTNHIKEEYIGHFLGLCSVYIEKMEKYQKKLCNKAKTSTVEELYKTIKSTQFIEDERVEFYTNFDDSFLKLFPDFVDKFNALLPEKERIILKPNETLTTELRIFALIRLGITDNTKIAEFLNYSLATIYNYRSRYRNKALVQRNEFEKEVLKIGSNAI